MGFAKAVDIPAFLVGDIHRGGVIASIVGTLAVLDPKTRHASRDFIINKFHGDVKLFENGKTYLEETTKLPCLGIIPIFPNARNLPGEDAVALEDMLATHSKGYKIASCACPALPILMTSTPCGLNPAFQSSFWSWVSPFPAIQILSSFPVPNPPWLIWLPCGPRAGISTSRPMSGGVAASSASAAAIRCWGNDTRPRRA